MGLMDSILGAAASAIGQTNGQQQTGIDMVMQLIRQSGGVGQLMEQLKQGGLGDALNSWVSQGDNESVSGSQIQNALGGLIGPVAEKFGLDANQASDLLAQNLPQLINQITPNGNSADADGFGLDDIARIALQQLFK